MTCTDRARNHGSLAIATLLAVGMAISACSSGSQSSGSSEELWLVEVDRVGNKTVASVNRCADDPVYIIADATGPEVERMLMEVGVLMATMIGDDPDACLDPEVRQAIQEERARHQAAVEQHLAELATRCEDVFVLVEAPNVYQRHTVCPDEPWASLPRTHQCDDLIILGEADVPTFQCRPVIDPPS